MFTFLPGGAHTKVENYGKSGLSDATSLVMNTNVS